MKIAVINGSPKGDYSVTLQTILYLQKRFKEHEFSVIPAAAKIRKYETGIEDIKPVLEQADLILFSYPVYTFMVPSQLHRFIEILKESAEAGKLSIRGKFVTQFSTSKHFYDVTAHNFIEENCNDLGLNYIKGLSADMEDLTKPEGQQDAEKFFAYVLWKMNDKLQNSGIDPEISIKKDTNLSQRPVKIVTDADESDTELKEMILHFQKSLNWPSEVVNIREFKFQGGCLGCLKCAATGKCVYKDGFDDFLRNNIQTGAAICYAFTVKDHSMGSYFKMYDDRQFCNGHRTVTMGSPIAYLIRGCYSKERNLKLILEARAETGGNFFAGAAADENGNISVEERNKVIEEVAAKMQYSLEKKYAPPSNFFGVGGMKIFRDLIFMMRGFMKADHRFFKEHGQYDFPQKKKGTTMLMYLVGALMSSEKVQKKMGNKMAEGMIAPYKKVIEKNFDSQER